MKMSKILKQIIFTSTVILSAIAIAYLISTYSLLSFLVIPIIFLIGLLIYYFTKDPFTGLLFVIFCLPFERLPSIDVGSVTLKINQFLGILLLLSWFLSILFKEKKITPNALVWPLVFFLLAGLLSIFNAEFQSRAIQVFIFVLFTALLFFATVSLVNSKERFQIVIKVIYWSAIITCLFALYQFAADILGFGEYTGLKKGYGKETLGFPRVQAFSQEPLYLANLLFIPLGLFCGMYLEKIDHIIKRKNLLLMIGLITLVILLTVSRGAYLGLAAFCVIFALLLAGRIFTVRYIVIGIISVTLIVSATLGIMKIASPTAYEKYIEHVAVEDYGEGESTEARLAAWYDAYDAYLEKPVFGIGLGNFGPWVKNYPDPESVEGWDIVNNEYLEILAETGLVGFITFTIFLLVIIIRSFIAYFKTKNSFNRAILVGLIAAVVAIFTQYNFFSTLYIIHIWVALGLLVAAQNLILLINVKEKK